MDLLLISFLPFIIGLLQHSLQLLNILFAFFFKLSVCILRIIKPFRQRVLDKFELFILVNQTIMISAQVVQLISQLLLNRFQFSYSTFQKLFLRLCVFSFLLLFIDKSGYFCIEPLLDGFDALFVLFLLLLEDLLIHVDLVSKCLLDTLFFLLQFWQSVLQNAVGCLCFTQFARPLLKSLLIAELLVKYVINQFARSKSQGRKCCFPILLRWEIFKPCWFLRYFSTC